jgi:hypothetical protein
MAARHGSAHAAAWQLRPCLNCVGASCGKHVKGERGGGEDKDGGPIRAKMSFHKALNGNRMENPTEGQIGNEKLDPVSNRE